MLHVCAVGTAGGFINYLDMTTVEKPRIIQGVRVYEGPVMQLVYVLTPIAIILMYYSRVRAKEV